MASMTLGERIRRAIDHQEPDLVPLATRPKPVPRPTPA
jgi:hypothetical protein